MPASPSTELEVASATNATAVGGEESLPAAWSWPRSHPWAVLFLTFILYATGSQIALTLIDVSGLSSVFFIPAGLTVAFLLRMERRYWWLVIVGAAAAEATMDFLAGYSLFEIAFFVSGNAIEPVIGALIVGTATRNIDLTRPRDLWWFVLGAVVTGPAVGAAIGTLGPHLLGTAEFSDMFPQWWLGDALGVVVVGSGILVWGSARDRRSLWSPLGFALLLGTSLLTVGVLGQSRTPLLFLVLVGTTVAGVVFGSRAVAMTAIIVSAAVAAHLVTRSASLIQGLDPASALVNVKLQIGVFTLAGLVVAAESAERARALAAQAEARLHALTLENDNAIEREVATRLQAELLPELLVDHPLIDAGARYEAGSEGLLAGGDWYDVFQLPDGKIGITVGDVVGHGLEAITSMGRIRSAVAALAPRARDPGELLSFLNTFVSGPDGTTYATAVYAILDADNGELSFASAGHPPMLLISPEGAGRWLTEGLSPPMYEAAAAERRPHATVRIPVGSTLLVYSDGLVESRNRPIQEGLDRLVEYAVGLTDRSAAEICEALVSLMGVEDRRRDDVVIVAIRYGDSPSGLPGTDH